MRRRLTHALMTAALATISCISESFGFDAARSRFFEFAFPMAERAAIGLSLLRSPVTFSLSPGYGDRGDRAAEIYDDVKAIPTDYVTRGNDRLLSRAVRLLLNSCVPSAQDSCAALRDEPADPGPKQPRLIDAIATAIRSGSVPRPEPVTIEHVAHDALPRRFASANRLNVWTLQGWRVKLSRGSPQSRAVLVS